MHNLAGFLAQAYAQGFQRLSHGFVAYAGSYFDRPLRDLEFPKAHNALPHVVEF
jgi:hypothetical protein